MVMRILKEGEIYLGKEKRKYSIKMIIYGWSLCITKLFLCLHYHLNLIAQIHYLVMKWMTKHSLSHLFVGVVWELPLKGKGSTLMNEWLAVKRSARSDT
ncbi:hypothetical protein MTR67_033103 [Solanum verrucosum]|uniref:Uncharacterized protein n=1 Tax=Solanum verrucosum TaxID=315347 RepID=A0AAF0U5Q9_SOLVR|nr:hypothetical protein MTR67_033103 [Solanum verrucosum]